MASLGNNPRRTNAVRPYKRPKVDLDELPPDYMALLSLLMGFAGLRYRLAAWGALFCCMSSFANMKYSEMDVKQMLCSAVFAIMGLFVNYFGKGARVAQ